MLQDSYSSTKIGFDTAENEPRQFRWQSRPRGPNNLDSCFSARKKVPPRAHPRLGGGDRPHRRRRGRAADLVRPPPPRAPVRRLLEFQAFDIGLEKRTKCNT